MKSVTQYHTDMEIPKKAFRIFEVPFIKRTGAGANAEIPHEL